MANKKISQLADANLPLTGDELVVLVQSGTNKKSTLDTVWVSLGDLDAITATNNGVVLQDNILYMQSASATKPGLVNTTTQTFAGIKTFNNGISIGSVGVIPVIIGGNAGIGFSNAPINGIYSIDVGTINATTVNMGTIDCTNGGTFQNNIIVQGSVTTNNLNITSSSINKLLGTDGTKNLVSYSLIEGSNITITQSGTNITIASSASGGGVTTIGDIDSQTASDNGGVIVGTDLYFQSASASKPGLINMTAQTFAGLKTFSEGLATIDNATYIKHWADQSKQLQFLLDDVPTSTVVQLASPSTSGTIAILSDLADYVPYTGATSNLNLDTHALLAGSIYVTTNTPNKSVAINSDHQLITVNTTQESLLGTIDGVNVTFNLSTTPLINSLLIFVNGLYQTPIENYSVSGTTITFVAAPQVGDNLRAVYQNF